MTYDADVAVVGLGSIGSMAAWRLAAAGRRVVGFEQYGVGHDHGAAGGETRRFATFSMGEQREVPLALASQRLYRMLEETTGRDLLTLNGGLVIGPDDAPGFVSAQLSVDTFSLPHRYLTNAELRAQYPEHAIRPEHSGLFDPQGGFIRPQLAVVAAAEAARGLGAVIRDHTRVLAIEPDLEGVTVVTPEGSSRFPRVVVCPGPWFSSLLPQFASRVQTRRVLQAWFIPRQVRGFWPSVFPVFQRTGDVRVYGFPTVDGATVKLGVTARIPELVDNPDKLDLFVQDSHYDSFREMVTESLPGLYPDPIRMSVYQEAYSTVMQGLIGPVADLPCVTAVFGLSGTGFKFAPIFGEIAAQYAIDGRTSYDIDYLQPDRLMPTWPS